MIIARKIALLALFAPTFALAQGSQLPKYTVATLPPASSMPTYIVQVIDGATSNDCTVGGGSYNVFCTPKAGAWTSLSSIAQGGTINGNLNVAGTVAAGAVNGLTNAALLTGSDIGAKINSYGSNGSLWIPDGMYNFSTPIVISQTAMQNLHIICSSRNTILNYTGAGNAIYYTGNTTRLAQLQIDNCSLTGTGAATNGVYLYDVQNTRITNMQINGFSGGAGIEGAGVIDGMFVGNDISNNKYGIYLLPDPVNSFGSNGNEILGGSLSYNSVLNFWDEGNDSAYGGDTKNVLNSVTLEQSTNTPQILIEGTWNDAIEDCYIEYLSFTSSTSNLFPIIIGNLAGSGYGSNLTMVATGFTFLNNYLITPKGNSYTTASILLENTASASILSFVDEGAPSYMISFSSSAGNVNTVIGNFNQVQQVGLFQNFPTTAVWSGNGQVTTPSLTSPSVSSLSMTSTGVLLASGPSGEILGTISGYGPFYQFNTNNLTGVTGGVTASFYNVSASKTPGWILDGNGNFGVGPSSTLASSDPFYLTPSGQINGSYLAGKILANCGTMTTTASSTNTLSCSWVTASSNCTATQNNTTTIVPWTAVVPTSGTVTVTHTATAGGIYSIACSAN